jgi:adenylosuccinate lyase
LLVKRRLVNLLDALSRFAGKTKSIPTLSYTHFQPAQPTTVGKRACMWLGDLMLDYEELEFAISSMRMRGAKGATGTQASFLELFGGDEEKVAALNRKIVSEMGFEQDFPLTSQTYPRKLDARILNCLSSIAQSLHKFATDMRLLQSLKELEEPFQKSQVGSSAMPYKRNPMKAERICSLARLVISLSLNPQMTDSVQWLERTLDDSANRRISMPEAFLATDAILSLAFEISSGIEVNEKVIASNLARELPFMAEENILMRAVSKGGNRQALHERLRTHSLTAARAIKKEGAPNPLISLIAADGEFMLSEAEIVEELDGSRYVGRAPSLAEEYLSGPVKKVLDENRALLGAGHESEV